ncbi:winged helix-turn-helix transcriptional regulator [Actinomyces provencensis]|uniref:winged helix-turn-helix transcriptional regulator n=1 Tax=Actinomyces provencensis TaxID=1720198 RepID=UPI00096A635B|nr:helix-turn-helix domain-containing protein [Actinomyces provencensis]
MEDARHRVAPAFDVFDERCPSRGALLDVTGRWGALTLLALARGATRFGEIHRMIGGSNERMLARTLRSLETDGLVSRGSVAPGRSAGYSLTGAGCEVAARVEGLVDALYGALAVGLQQD